MRVVKVDEDRGTVERLWSKSEAPNVYAEIKRDEAKAGESSKREIFNAGVAGCKEIFKSVMNIPTFGWAGKSNESIRQWLYWLRNGVVTREQFLEYHHWVPSEKDLESVTL